ncbi:hypothetical protein [Nostoc sp. MG11]|nr:hypothetical protein [Nostoc sp. MG11]
MDTDRVIFSTQWIAVRESSKGFQYLERNGKDSVRLKSMLYALHALAP